MTTIYLVSTLPSKSLRFFHTLRRDTILHTCKDLAVSLRIHPAQRRGKPASSLFAPLGRPRWELPTTLLAEANICSDFPHPAFAERSRPTPVFTIYNICGLLAIFLEVWYTLFVSVRDKLTFNRNQHKCRKSPRKGVFVFQASFCMLKYLHASWYSFLAEPSHIRF